MTTDDNGNLRIPKGVLWSIAAAVIGATLIGFGSVAVAFGRDALAELKSVGVKITTIDSRVARLETQGQEVRDAVKTNQGAIQAWIDLQKPPEPRH